MPPRVEHKEIDGVECKLCKGVLCTKITTDGIWKPLEEFGKDSQKWDLLRTMCKECKNANSRKEYNKEPGEIKEETVNEPKEEPKAIGRPNAMKFGDIEEYLLAYNLFVLDDIEETDQPSKSYVHISCDLGHECTARFDTIKSFVKEYEEGKRYAICSDCNVEKKELKKLMDNEDLVIEKGFILSKMYNNTRGDLVYDILCKNSHLTIGRNKSSFLRSFECKDCKHNADEYICSSCQKLLPLDKFNKCETNTHRNKTDHHCIECRAKQREVRKENDYKKPTRQTIIENDIEGKICCTEGCGFHPYSEYWSDSNNEDGHHIYCIKCRKIFNKKYEENNKEKIKEVHKNYRKQNKEKLTASRKEWIKNNIEKHRESNRNYSKKRRDSDPRFKLLGNLRHRLYMAMKGQAKSATTKTLIGCTIDELWIYLEERFVDGMSKENYGLIWHVDHVIPCDSFDLTIPEEQYKCFHHTNLQPLFAEDNWAKSNKVPSSQ